MEEGKERDANPQRSNILAARAVAQTVRSTLGPKGMDKMIVSEGEVIVTNDGVTILDNMKIEHPAAKMIAEVAKTQEENIGDGTTTAVIFAGELLKKAESLLDQKIHPTIIAKGYRLAEKEAQRLLLEFSKETYELRQVAITAMTGKGAAKEELATLLEVAAQKLGKNLQMDLKVEHLPGDGESQIISGVVLDKEKVHPSLPSRVENARIALLDCPLEIKTTEIDAKIQITSPNQLQEFLNQEENNLQSMVDCIKAAGANVVFCQRGIDDLAQHFLGKYNIMAARRVRRSDLERLSRATNARICSNFKDLSSGDLGVAEVVEEKLIAGEEMIFVQGCSHPKSMTLLLRGGTEHVGKEVKRAVVDAIGDLQSIMEDKLAVPGAGAIEMALAKGLKVFAGTLSGREQLAVQAFAEGLEIIPRTLAENAGLDPIDVLTSLRSAHDLGNHVGIDVFTGNLLDSWREGVIEPWKVKKQALVNAAEVAEMILRIDDIILGK
jgi:archaeal chaperonin